MNHFKKYLSMLLALSLMLTAFSGCGKKAAPAATEAAPVETAAAPVAETEAPAQQAASDGHYHIGDKIDDFTITTFDGKEINLYELMEEKDMVLLNFWATYCGPCAGEFPAMQEAYEQYQDKVGIIALSTSPFDTDEALAEYVQEKGMTFHVGRDTLGLADRFHVSGIPTSVVVDRFGVICAIASGGEPETSVFTNVFGMFTAEDYTESIFMPKLSSELVELEPSDPAELSAALNVEGGNLVFSNPASRFYWPMTVAEKDGRTVVVASNLDVADSAAMVEFQVEVQAGDVLAMEYKMDSDYNLNSMHITVDKQDVKVSSLSKDWTTTYYQFENSGTHQISISYHKLLSLGAEGLWIDSIRLVNGDEAAQVMAEKPQYPVGKEIRLNLLNENAELAAIVEKETGEVVDRIKICGDPVLRIAMELSEAVDPESAFLMDTVGNVYPLTSFVNGDGYLVEIPNPDPAEYSSSIVHLYFNGTLRAACYIFASLEQGDAYAHDLGVEAGFDLKAVLWDDSMALPEAPAGDGTYTVTYVDQNGDPVPGVMCQVCDANSCQVFVSNADGVCEFTLPAGIYEIHTLKVPDGYEGDTTTVTEAPVGGGELNFTLTKK